MSTQSSDDQPNPSDAAARLREASKRLQQAEHLEPEAQQRLAELANQLADAHATGHAPSSAADLANSTANLLDAVHEPHRASLLAAARQRVERAMLRAEGQAPLAVGLAREIVEMLANIGI